MEAKKQFSRLGLGAFVMLVSATFFQFAAALIVYLIFPNGDEPGWLMWLYTFAPMYLIAMPLGLLVMRLAPPTPVEKRSMGAGELAVAALVAFFLMYAGNLVGNLVIQLFSDLTHETPTNPLIAYTENEYVLLRVLVMVILAPLLEEFIFRKTLIDRMNAYGGSVAVVTSALMFGLFHGNLSQFFYAFAIGLVLGYLYIRTGRLRYSAGLHMLINFMGGVVAPALLNKIDLEALEQIDMASYDAAIGEIFTQILPLLAYGFVMFALSVAGLVFFCKRVKKTTFDPAPLELQKTERFRTVFLNVGMILFTAVCLLSMAATFVI